MSSRYSLQLKYEKKSKNGAGQNKMKKRGEKFLLRYTSKFPSALFIISRGYQENEESDDVTIVYLWRHKMKYCNFPNGFRTTEISLLFILTLVFLLYTSNSPVKENVQFFFFVLKKRKIIKRSRNFIFKKNFWISKVSRNQVLILSFYFILKWKREKKKEGDHS